MNNIRFLRLKATLFACLTVLAVLRSGRATGQDFERRYEQSLLDSAINYEMLKPRYYTLTKSHEQLLREVVELRMQLRLLSFEQEAAHTNFVKQLEAEKRKRRRLILIGGGMVIVRMVIR